MGKRLHRILFIGAVCSLITVKNLVTASRYMPTHPHRRSHLLRMRA